MTNANWQARLRDGGFVAVILASIVVVGMTAVRGQGNLRFDEATYLERGLYHAHQVERRVPALLRLGYSLTFESPKPPLLHAMIAATALLAGDATIATLVAVATVVPWTALLVGSYCLARRVWPQDEHAGLGAAALVCAATGFTRFAPYVLVEILLSACVVFAVGSLQARLGGGGIGAGMGAGAAFGLAMMAKATAVLFLLPPFCVAAWFIARSDGIRRAIRFLLVSGGVAFVIAGPWYLRNGPVALGYAAHAATFPPNAWKASVGDRLVSLVVETLGPAWLVAVPALLLWWRSRGGRAESSPDVQAAVLAVATALPAGSVIASAPSFETRLLMPGLAPGIALLGAMAWRGAPRLGGIGRWCLELGIVALAVIGVVRVAATPVELTPWSMCGLFRELSRASTARIRVGTIGASPGFNIYKARLLIEKERLRERFSTVDVSGQAANGRSLLEAIRDCDVIVLVGDGTSPVDAGAGEARREGARAAETALAKAVDLVRCLRCEEEITEGLPLRVYIRAGLEPKGPDGTEAAGRREVPHSRLDGRSRLSRRELAGD